MREEINGLRAQLGNLGDWESREREVRVLREELDRSQTLLAKRQEEFDRLV